MVVNIEKENAEKSKTQNVNEKRSYFIYILIQKAKTIK